MSNLDDNLQLHLKLDEVTNQNGTAIVEDASGNNHNGTVHGATLVADDTFGSCLSFDGTNDYVDCGSGNFQIKGSNVRTIMAWAYTRSFNDGGIFQAGPTGTTAKDFSLRTYKSDNLWRMQFWGTDKDITLQNSKNTWNHYALVYNGSIVSLYYNGLLKTTKIISLNTGENNLWIGKWSNDYFNGKIAHIRSYNKALSEQEVKQTMEKDLTAQQIFKLTYPVDFNLSDDNEQNVLYISDDVARNQAQLTLQNTSGRVITFDALNTSAAASSSNAHFELKFRPQTFTPKPLSGGSADQLQYPALTPPSGWKVSPATKNSDNTLSLYLLKTANLSLAAEAQINFTLNYSSADGSLGTRGTRVELAYRNLRYQGGSEPLQASRLKQVDIVNQRGKKNIPLYVGIVGSNTVLNDATSGNSATGAQSTLRICLLNTLQADSSNAEKSRIAFHTTGAASTRTKFTIAFDSFTDDRALGTASEVQAISISNGTGYTVQKHTQGLSTTFEITPTQSYLAPGASLDITLTNVRSSKASGLANIYVRYEDIPGYWDGQFTCQVEKTPIVHKMFNDSRNVGIGTSPDASNQLKVGGSLSIDGVIHTTHNYIQLGTSSFTIAGNSNKWYPIVFQDDAWSNGALKLEILRPNVHTNSNWFGSLMCQVECHASAWGHGSNYWKMSVRQYNKKFVGGFQNIYRSRKHIIWLLGGNITYYWRSNQPATLLDSNANQKSLDNETFSVKDKLDNPYNFNSYEKSDGAGGSSSTPTGMIMMWSGNSNAIPGGWALCNGQSGTPDLRDRFIVGAGNSYSVKNTGGYASVTLNSNQMPSHTHSGYTNTDGSHSHNHIYNRYGNAMKTTWQSGDDQSMLDLAKNDSGGSNLYVGSSGSSHRHYFTTGSTGSGQSHENRPPYYALCFIMKL